MHTALILLVIGAFILTLAEALGKCPGWVPKVLICVALILMVVGGK